MREVITMEELKRRVQEYLDGKRGIHNTEENRNLVMEDLKNMLEGVSVDNVRRWIIYIYEDENDPTILQVSLKPVWE